MTQLCCGSLIEVDRSVQLLGNPPKYKGVCKECGKVFYVKVSN